MEKHIGKICIVRTNHAGVFFGTLSEMEGDTASIINCRRLWYWDGAASLSELAVNGVTLPRNCKFCIPVQEITVLGVIEIIPCTDKAIESINSVPVWKMSK